MLKNFEQAEPISYLPNSMQLQITAMEKENTDAKERDDNREVNLEFHNLADNETDRSPPQQTLSLLFQ